MTDAERDEIVRHARNSLVAYLTGGVAPVPPAEGAFAAASGLFVTLRLQHELRGCIGHVESDKPLGSLIGRTAIAAATSDPRFPPLSQAELDAITIEVSVLGPLEMVESIEQIEVGRHGLVIEQGRSRGLLLPQVATEWRWDREAFLAHTCQKAGLPPDAWKHGAKIWRFEAEVIEEG